jgi:hypothetical protein
MTFVSQYMDVSHQCLSMKRLSIAEHEVKETYNDLLFLPASYQHVLPSTTQ